MKKSTLFALSAVVALSVSLAGGCSKAGESVATTDTTRYEYDLSRILFLLPEVHDVPSASETKAIISQRKRLAALKSEYQKRLKVAKIAEHSLKPSLDSTNDFALITCNGKTLYNSQVQLSVRLVQHLEKIKNKNIKERKLKQAAQNVMKRAIASFVSDQIYSDYAKEHKIVIDDSLMASNRLSFAKNHRSPDFASLCQKLTPTEVSALKEQMRDALLKHKAQDAILDASDLSVSDEEVSATLSRFQKIYEISSATNAIIYATASNVYQRIRSREITFEEAFQDYNQDDEADDNGGWCTVSLNQLTHDDQFALAERLRTAKPGDVLPPMKLDNALCIVKVTAKRVATDKESAPTGNEKETK